MSGELDFLRQLAYAADQAPVIPPDVAGSVARRLRTTPANRWNRPLVGVAIGASLAACLVVAFEFSNQSRPDREEEAPAMSMLASSELVGPDFVMEVLVR